jgi:hypothetical protein
MGSTDRDILEREKGSRKKQKRRKETEKEMIWT